MAEYGYQELLHTPEGLWDHYGRDYAEYMMIADRIMQRMHVYGYEDIKTPTFEYFDVFSKEIGTTPSRELYKFFDKEGDTLVLRPDFTPSVARCIAKYYREEKQPIRFCYEGSVFSNNSNLQGKLKESTQMGAELMNDGSVYADAEMVALLCESLLAAGLERFQITLGNVEYFKGVCDAAGMDAQTEKELREYISGKNFFAAQDFLESRGVEKKYRDQFLKITDFMGSDLELEEAAKTAPNERSKKALERLIEVYDILKAYGLQQYVSFDLTLLSKYRYYTGIIFKAYTYGVGEAVASGGRYDILLSHFGKDAAATGFMIPLDILIEARRMQHIPFDAPEDPVAVTYTDKTFREALEKVKQLRKQGVKVRLIPENIQ